ncbi:proteasome subunit beta type-4 [Copidosoma floridanum]|uniref:proteasome subunit beta type-4 n=1 Tax=Copidosoma floridanum TaxID=29053 RepID=UPI0006C9AFF3|nr:proteasome subunit beta type-4 [Copidosoma floridanum]
MTFENYNTSMQFPNQADYFSSAPFWGNGPTPGALYNFPGTSTTSPDNLAIKRTHTPIVTGTSVLGLRFKDGVLIAADSLGSYGSLAKFRNCQRVLKVNNNIIVGAGGDYADYQYLKSIIEQKVLDEQCLDDGFTLKPKALHCWLTRVLYNRRSNFDPLWNNFIIGGIENNETFLGTVDKLGTAFMDSVIATGYGAYLASPILTKAYEANNQMSEEEATDLIYKVMQVLFYRDARSFPKYHIAVITKEKGVEIKGPITIGHNWEVAEYEQTE